MQLLSSGVISFPGLGLEFDLPSGFPLFGLQIKFYSIIIVAGILLALLYAWKVKERYNLTGDNLLDAVIYGTPAAIIGARLYYVIFMMDNYDSFWDIFKIWEGGIAIYGAVIAVIITGVIFAKLNKINFFSLMDVVSLGLLIGQSVGRWGNFFNREAFGSETDLPWRMDIEGVTYDAHPTFLYESLWNLLGFVLLHFYSKNKYRKAPGEIFILYMGWYGLGRSMIEGLRTDSLYIGESDIRVSQLLGLLFFLASIILFALLRMKAQKKEAELEAAEYVPVYTADGVPAAGDGEETGDAGESGASDADGDASEEEEDEEEPDEADDEEEDGEGAAAEDDAVTETGKSKEDAEQE